MPNVEDILLGSGKLYIAELDNGGAIPSDIVSEANCVGDIKGGATLSYAPEIKEIKNDDDETRKIFIIREVVKLKTGVMTWALETMNKLSVGGTYDSTGKKLTIGGVKSVKQYAFVFVSDQDFGNLTVTLKGSNLSGWEIAFNPENETVVDAEITAAKQNGGTLVTIEQSEAE